MAFERAWRPFPTTRKNRGEARRKLELAVEAGDVRRPPIQGTRELPEKITTTVRYHDWLTGVQQGLRVHSVCRGCGAEKVFVVKRDGSMLRLYGPPDGKCAVRTEWARKRMAKQEAAPTFQEELDARLGGSGATAGWRK